MSLMIGSVFCNHSRSQDWYNLQQYFLQATTKNYVHVVCSNKCSASFSSSNVIQGSPIGVMQKDHATGLNLLLDYFYDNPDFNYLLLLDSDCFPIFDSWQGKLMQSMGNNFGVAAVVRYENLDNFAHPSGFFIKKTPGRIRFDVLPYKNIVGSVRSEVISNCWSFFPLVRTNSVNYHPILYGVYYDVFYHHAAGSRLKKFFSDEIGYYDKISINDEEQKFLSLVKNPHQFLKDIMYPKQTRNLKM